MRRAAVGVLALILLAVAGYGFARNGFDAGEASFFWNSCWRMGLVLGAVWLALPNFLNSNSNASPLTLILAGVTGLVIVLRPRAILLLWPIFIILAVAQFWRWLMHPPPKRPKKNNRP